MEKIEKIVEKILETVTVLFFSGVLFFTALQVFFRYVLSAPLMWSEELARYLFIWGVLIASILALQKKMHIGIEVITEKLLNNEKMRFVSELIIESLIAFFSSFVVYYGFIMVNKLDATTSPALKIPMALVYLAIPVCSIFWFIISITKIVKISRIYLIKHYTEKSKVEEES